MMTKKYRKLTPEVLTAIAKQYKTKREFFNADSSAYVSASRKTIEVPNPNKKGDMMKIKLLEYICGHMSRKRYQWTKEMILNAAADYETRGAFAVGTKAAYSAAIRQKCLDEVCAHMLGDQRVKKNKKGSEYILTLVEKVQ